MTRTIIIDDEEDARESLKLLLNKFCPNLNIIAICQDPMEGISAIQTHQPELVFLDVQMPFMSGFDLLEKIGKPNFSTIFVTAHNQYAIKAIRFSALDYLLKPVDVDELLTAVNRFHNLRKTDYSGLIHNIKSRLGLDDKLAVPTLNGLDFVYLQDIIHCKAEGAYTQIILKDSQQIVVSKSLKDFENILDPSIFCRVHHSAIINLKQIDRYIKGEGGYALMSNGDHIDISRRKKEEFMKLIARL